MKRALIITSHFPPSNAIGSRRPIKLCSALKKSGWTIAVETATPETAEYRNETGRDLDSYEIFRSSPTTNRDISRTPTFIRMSSAVRSLAARSILGEQIKSLTKRLLFGREFPDEHFKWIDSAVERHAQRDYDLIVSTIPHFSAAIIGARLSRLRDAPFVLDYRDPWSEIIPILDPTVARSDFYKHQSQENMCLAAASVVTTVSPGIQKILTAKTNVVLPPVRVIPHGIEYIDDKTATPAGADFLYAGSLAYSRSLKPLMIAMKELKAAYTPNEMRLKYYGPHHNEVTRDAVELGIIDYVQSLPAINSEALKSEYKKKPIGIVIVTPGYEYAYPGKLFEKVGRRLPIVMLGDLESESAKLIKENNLGWAFDVNDTKKRKELIIDKRKKDTPPIPQVKRLAVNSTMTHFTSEIENLFKNARE